MADDQDWTKRRQRVAKCKIHGLHFDPELTSGCVLCRKEGLAAEPRTRPQLVVLLLTLLGLVVVLSRFFDTRASVLAPSVSDDVPEAAAAAPARDRLDPEAYRPALEAVERAIFETPAQDLDTMRDQFSYSLRRLNRQLNATPEAPTAATVAAVDDLGERLYLQPFDLEVIRDHRQAWIELRERHFDRALWFKVAARIDPRTDRVALTTYQQVVTDLLSLLDEGSSRAQELSQPAAPNFTDPEDEAQKREEWSLFQADWQARMKALRGQLPDRPSAAADPKILAAAQRLESLFARLPSLGGSGIPAAGQIDQVAASAEETRRSFEDLLAP